MYHGKERSAFTQFQITRRDPPYPTPPRRRRVEHLAGIIAIGTTLKHSGWHQRNREVCRFCFRPVQFDGGTEKHLLISPPPNGVCWRLCPA
jgi:hypothetical protein